MHLYHGFKVYLVCLVGVCAIEYILEEENGAISRTISVDFKSTHLKGGPKSYEGLVEVEINGTWYNLCGDRPLPNASNICSNRIGSKPVIYYRNVFGASRTGHVFNVTACHVKEDIICEGQTVLTCDKLISVCCQLPNPKDACSANWTTTFHSEFHHSQIKPRIEKLKDYTFNTTDEINTQLSWTNYALNISEESDIHSTFNEHLNLTSCANEWLKMVILKTGEDQFDNTSCPQFELDNKMTNIELCIACKVVNGRPILEALNCSTYLPPFTVHISGEVTDTDTGEDYHVYQYEDTDGNTNPLSGADIVIVLSTASAIISILCVCIIVICMRRYCNRMERNVRNGMDNQGYGLSPNKDCIGTEVYALINESEVSSSVNTEQYRPSLPTRVGEPRDNLASQEVRTLDEYSLPNDSVPERDIDTVYIRTYDDPMRINLERAISNELETSM